MPVTTFRRIKWVLLAAVPSSLMLGITTYISTDLSPFPLIWAVPLALYLLSFILVYLKWPMPWTVSEGSTTTPHTVVMYFLQPLMIVGLCWLVLSRGFDPMYMFVAWIAFFCTALACHGELARDRPNPKHLTEYFLLMSVGGALGGFFNAIVAPVAFAGITEFYITLVLAAFVRPILIETGWFDNFVMNTFPNTRSWAVDQSDQLSRSFGKEPDGSTYVLSYTLDVLLGFFVLCLCWFLRQQSEWGWFNPDRAFKWLSVLSGSERTGALHWDKMYHAVIWGVPLVFCFFFSPQASPQAACAGAAKPLAFVRASCQA